MIQFLVCGFLLSSLGWTIRADESVVEVMILLNKIAKNLVKITRTFSNFSVQSVHTHIV